MTYYPEAETDQDIYITESMVEELLNVLEPENLPKYADWYVAEMRRQMHIYLAQCEREDGPLMDAPQPRIFLLHGGMHA